MRYAKKHKNTIHNKENFQWKETDTKVVQMLELAENIKMVI